MPPFNDDDDPTLMTTPTTESSSTAGDDLEIRIRLWMKAEEVAMHFNALILNFRLKAVGAVTVGAGLFSILLTKESVSSPRLNYELFAGAMVFLSLVWIGILWIDIGYYSRLLRGAVWEAVRLEKASGGAIRLSLMIDKAVAGRSSADEGDDEDERDNSVGRSRWAFYLLPLAAFLGAAGLAIYKALA